jgi:hypothetical protein
MSDVRDYLLTVDRDKEGALKIAQGTALSILSLFSCIER